MNTLTNGELHNILEDQILNPNIRNETEYLMNARNKWKKISNICETTGHLLILISTVLSFAAGIYNGNELLCFFAGGVNVTSISMLKFSSYALGESIERNKILNTLLERYNIGPIPIYNSPVSN